MNYRDRDMFVLNIQKHLSVLKQVGSGCVKNQVVDEDALVIIKACMHEIMRDYDHFDSEISDYTHKCTHGDEDLIASINARATELVI